MATFVLYLLVVGALTAGGALGLLAMLDAGTRLMFGD